MTQTNITQSNALLAQFQLWAALEPDLCRVDTYDETIRNEEDDLAIVPQSDIHLKLGSGWTTVWGSGISEIHSAGLAIVQAVAQQAIAAKDWELCLELDRALFPTAPWSAVICQPDERSFEACSEAPAIALLNAYLQALQAARATA